MGYLRRAVERELVSADGTGGQDGARLDRRSSDAIV
jgi:hypothetical protein